MAVGKGASGSSAPQNTAAVGAAEPAIDINAARRQRLARVRALAAGLLALSAAAFAATLLVSRPGMWVLLVRAVAEAALAGGLADWFAVTALFRRPFGLPIPHTAIVPANKIRIGEGLGRFLERHFLTPEVLVPELRSLQIAERVARWLADRRNAAAVARELTKALPSVLQATGDRQIKAFLARALGAQLRQARLGPLAGRLVQLLGAAGYHERVLDSAIEYARRYLAQNREELLDAVTERRRGWIPRAINREIARAMLRGAAELLDDLYRADSAARQSLVAAIARFAAELTQSPDLTEPLSSILHSPEIRAWFGDDWDRVRDQLQQDFSSPSSRMRRALALAIASLGEALATDPVMRERLDRVVETLAIEAMPWRAELIRFITEVVRQWEPRSFSDRIEAAVGADLQYIRMNGTVVGGLVGGALYALSLLAH